MPIESRMAVQVVEPYIDEIFNAHTCLMAVFLNKTREHKLSTADSIFIKGVVQLDKNIVRAFERGIPWTTGELTLTQLDLCMRATEVATAEFTIRVDGSTVKRIVKDIEGMLR